MAKFLIYTDVHLSEFSSIIRSQGTLYSTRLENIIKSVSWAEAEADKHNCDEIICLGDFFNRPDLNSKELTALKDIKWSKLPHTFIVGNHEASVRSLAYNSVNALKANNFNIIDKPSRLSGPGYDILMLPYIEESDRQSLDYYWNTTSDNNSKIDSDKVSIILSHNAVKGIQYGPVISKEGFQISDIEKSCKLFLNGHIHNGSKFCKNGINIGNLTGQNFNEDAFNYNHCAFILDTQACSLDVIENPYAFNFYQFDCLNNDFKVFSILKNNCILSIRCDEVSKSNINDIISQFKDKIIEKRITLIKNISNIEVKVDSLKKGDHLVEFVKFCKEHIENTDILNIELSEVCK